MNILYLSEDYIASKVHHELVSRLIGLGHKVTVFSVVRLADAENDIRKTFDRINYHIITFELPKKLEIPYKILFGLKKRIKFSKLIREIEPAEIDMVHAATIFSEGIVAYELYKRYKIPYTVTVRGSDIELYLSKMPHLWSLGKKILQNSKKIIFVSPILQKKFETKTPIKTILPSLSDRFIVIPNGIEDFWIQNSISPVRSSFANNILYIGRFDKNKNVENLVKAVLELRNRIPGLKLNMVGGGDSCHSRIVDYCNKFPDTITYLGKIYDKQELLQVMRENQVFAMISHSETFGLVYLEALSQGLPILYTAGQGIDGSVPDEVGEKVNPTDLADIVHKLGNIIDNYPHYRLLSKDIHRFSWDSIATEYSNIFKGYN